MVNPFEGVTSCVNDWSRVVDELSRVHYQISCFRSRQSKNELFKCSLHLIILDLPNLSNGGQVTLKVPVGVVILIEATALKCDHSEVDYWISYGLILKAPDAHEGFVVIKTKRVVINIGPVSWVAVSSATCKGKLQSENTGFVVSDLKAANDTGKVGVHAITLHKTD